MAATVQADFNDHSIGSTATFTLTSVAVGAGTNLGLLVFVAITTGSTITDVTYGGVVLSEVSQVVVGGWRRGIYELPNPTVGTADVIVRLSGSELIGVGAYVLTEYGGVRNVAHANATSGTDATVGVTSASGDLVLDMVASTVNNQTFAVGAGQTSHFEEDSIATTDIKCAGSEEAGAAGTVTMSWTLGTSGTWSIGAASIYDDGTANELRIAAARVQALQGDVPTELRIAADRVQVLQNAVPTELRVAAHRVQVLVQPAPVPPTPGGILPTGVEPLVADLPVGVIRIFALLTYGSGSPYSEMAVAETDLNDPSSWYGGYKAPWLLEVSSISRELADDLRGTDVTLTVADPDRFFRTLAATDTLGGATWEIFLVSDTVRYALGEPHRRFAGRVHSHRALSGMRYEFTIRDVLSDELAQLADAPRIPPGRLTQTLFPGMTADYENRAIPIALGEVSDEDAITPQGVVPPLIVAPSMNLTTFGGINVEVVGAILSHGALPPNGLWRGYYNTINDPYTRIPIPASAWGTILTAPGQPGWAYVGVATDYIDFPSTPTLTHRYTPVFFLRSDPNVQAVLDGRIQVAFNVYGLTDEADGSGLYFEDAPDIYEFLIRNWLYTPHWRYGAYNGTPTFSRGYSIVNHDSVVTARTRLKAFMGSPGEFPVGFLLGGDGQQQTLRHVLTELCHGVLMEQGFDRHGRILLDVEDVDAAATLTLSDLLDVEDGEFDVWIDRSDYHNTTEYVFGRRYLPAVAPLPTPPEGETLPPVNVGPHNDWSAVGAFEHTDAIVANQGRRTPPLQLENYVVRNSDVARNWAQRYINRLVGPGPSYDGQRRFRLTTSWQALEVELGDVIAIDHVDGLGATGFEGQRARVLKITDDLQRGRITIEGRLLYSGGSPS